MGEGSYPINCMLGRETEAGAPRGYLLGQREDLRVLKEQEQVWGKEGVTLPLGSGA